MTPDQNWWSIFSWLITALLTTLCVYIVGTVPEHKTSATQWLAVFVLLGSSGVCNCWCVEKILTLPSKPQENEIER